MKTSWGRLQVGDIIDVKGTEWTVQGIDEGTFTLVNGSTVRTGAPSDMANAVELVRDAWQDRMIRCSRATGVSLDVLAEIVMRLELGAKE